MSLIDRNCFRCGKYFTCDDSFREKVCPRCRIPRNFRQPKQGDPLSRRETQIGDLVVLGKLNKEIAWELGLTTGTITEYMGHIFKKLGIVNRSQLAVWVLTKRQEDSRHE